MYPSVFADRRLHILHFLTDLLNDPMQRFMGIIRWTDQDGGEFQILDPNGLASLWGDKKNLTNMTYDKMSRALRYYYKAKVLSKCGRLSYRFHWDEVRSKRIGLQVRPDVKVEKGYAGPAFAYADTNFSMQ